MAKICFTWELGQGFGHLVRYLNLIRRLVERGDEVSFLAKDAARARTVFAGLPVHIEQIEPGHTPDDKSLPHLKSYPEILYNYGFFAPDALARQVQPWLQRMATLVPDVLIVDHSPMALLANRACRIPCVLSGSGFTVPPRSTPMPPMRYWELRRDEQLAAHEDHVLEVCNEVLRRAGAPPMGALSELLAAEREWLLSFAELDHYGLRKGARYLGNFPASEFGVAPQWPDGSRPRVFAYLSGGSLSQAFVDAVGASGAGFCVYAPNLGPPEFHKLASPAVCRVESPVDLGLAAAQCEAVVTHGTLNTVSAFLLAGKPQLALPNNLERYMVGRRLELIGAGLMAPLFKPGDVAAKLRAVLSDRAFTRAARRFAGRYAGADPSQQVKIMLADVDDLLQRDGIGSVD